MIFRLRFFVIMLIMFLPIFSINLCAQRTVQYNYDSTGNRIARLLIYASASHAPSRQPSCDTIPVVDHSLSHEVRIYPNPTRGRLQITIAELQQEDKCSLSLFGVSGVRLFHADVSESSTTLDMCSYQNGYYLLSIELNGEKQTWKIIKE